MGNIRVSAACGLALLCCEACGGAISSASPAASGKTSYLEIQLRAQTFAGLPACDASTAGETAAILATDTLVACDSGAWVPVLCSSLAAGAAAYDSATQTLWACTYISSGKSWWSPIPLQTAPAQGRPAPPDDP